MSSSRSSNDSSAGVARLTGVSSEKPLSDGSTSEMPLSLPRTMLLLRLPLLPPRTRSSSLPFPPRSTAELPADDFPAATPELSPSVRLSRLKSSNFAPFESPCLLLCGNRHYRLVGQRAESQIALGQVDVAAGGQPGRGAQADDGAGQPGVGLPEFHFAQKHVAAVFLRRPVSPGANPWRADRCLPP